MSSRILKYGKNNLYNFYCITCQVKDPDISHSNMFVKWLSSHYYPCVRGGTCSSFRCMWGAQDQMVDVGRIVDLADNQASAECLWLWVLFNTIKVALFGFSWLKLMNRGYFKLKLNKDKNHIQGTLDVATIPSCYVMEIQLLSANIKWYQFYLCWPNGYFLHLEPMWWFVWWWKT